VDFPDRGQTLSFFLFFFVERLPFEYLKRIRILRPSFLLHSPFRLLTRTRRLFSSPPFLNTIMIKVTSLSSRFFFSGDALIKRMSRSGVFPRLTRHVLPRRSFLSLRALFSSTLHGRGERITITRDELTSLRTSASPAAGSCSPIDHFSPPKRTRVFLREWNCSPHQFNGDASLHPFLLLPAF